MILVDKQKRDSVLCYPSAESEGYFCVLLLVGVQVVESDDVLWVIHR